MERDWRNLAERLSASLRPTVPPIAITFSAAPPSGVDRFDDPLPPPGPDGRTGRVSAGCVFWTRATDRTFTTVPEDHGNCSVGSLTHGLVPLERLEGRADVEALVASQWVPPDALSTLPVVSGNPGAVTYGPLAETPVEPDVVLVRLTGRWLMTLFDAVPDLRVEGKPQCHILALAREHQEVAASVGCMLSRVRTGMASTEVSCAIPAARLAEVVESLERVGEADAAVAAYAGEDARRFR
jgi:uncharacterized protein (DUF169 family)